MELILGDLLPSIVELLPIVNVCRFSMASKYLSKGNRLWHFVTTWDLATLGYRSRQQWMNKIFSKVDPAKSRLRHLIGDSTDLYGVSEQELIALWTYSGLISRLETFSANCGRAFDMSGRRPPALILELVPLLNVKTIVHVDLKVAEANIAFAKLLSSAWVPNLKTLAFHYSDTDDLSQMAYAIASANMPQLTSLSIRSSGGYKNDISSLNHEHRAVARMVAPHADTLTAVNIETVFVDSIPNHLDNYFEESKIHVDLPVSAASVQAVVTKRFGTTAERISIFNRNLLGMLLYNWMMKRNAVDQLFWNDLHEQFFPESTAAEFDTLLTLVRLVNNARGADVHFQQQFVEWVLPIITGRGLGFQWKLPLFSLLADTCVVFGLKANIEKCFEGLKQSIEVFPRKAVVQMARSFQPELFGVLSRLFKESPDWAAKNIDIMELVDSDGSLRPLWAILGSNHSLFVELVLHADLDPNHENATVDNVNVIQWAFSTLPPNYLSQVAPVLLNRYQGDIRSFRIPFPVEVYALQRIMADKVLCDVYQRLIPDLESPVNAQAIRDFAGAAPNKAKLILGFMKRCGVTPSALFMQSVAFKMWCSAIADSRSPEALQVAFRNIRETLPEMAVPESLVNVANGADVPQSILAIMRRSFTPEILRGILQTVLGISQPVSTTKSKPDADSDTCLIS